MKFPQLNFIFKKNNMAKKEQSKKQSSVKINEALKKVHKIGDDVKAWKPTVDKTTKPPKKK